MFGIIKGLVAKEKAKMAFWQDIKTYLADGMLTDEEKADLEKQASALGLTEKEVHDIYKRAGSLSWDQITSDHKITEEEKATFEDLLKYFGVKPEETSFDQKNFNKLYTLGLIENGVLPTVHSDLNLILKKDEIVHWACPAVVRQHKTVTQRVSYSGLHSSVRIMKGLSYRAGSYRIQTQSKDVVAVVDSGAFYITNQRCGFQGNRKNFSVPINKIAYINLLPEGLLIAKEGRETPFLIGLEDYEVPAAELSYLLNHLS